MQIGGCFDGILKAATPLEGSFADLLGEPSKDSPDAHTRAVAALYQSVQQGHLNQEGDDTRFFVLGLAPNTFGFQSGFGMLQP